MRSAGALLLRLAHPTRPVRDRDLAALREHADTLHPLAAAHRVEGWLAFRLESVADDVDPSLLDALRRTRHRTALANQRARKRLREILDRFGDIDISCLPLKGVDLAFRLYPDPGLRPFEDLDLLVPRDKVRDAVAVLQGLGYAVPNSLLPPSWVRRFHFHLPFVHEKDGTFVELHWALADRPVLPPSVTDAAWSQSLASPSGTRTMPAPLYALYLHAHLAKHGCLNDRLAAHPDPVLFLHPWSDLRLIWFLDLFLLMERSQLSLENLLAHAPSDPLRRAVHSVQTLMQRAFAPEPIPTGPAPKQGLIERRIKDKLIGAMERHLETDTMPPPPPWILRTNKRLHIRPIRFVPHAP